MLLYFVSVWADSSTLLSKMFLRRIWQIIQAENTIINFFSSTAGISVELECFTNIFECFTLLPVCLFESEKQNVNNQFRKMLNSCKLKKAANQLSGYISPNFI